MAKVKKKQLTPDEATARKQESLKGWDYSIQRMDILVIAISGSGIYLTLELMKYFRELKLPIHESIKWAGVFFTCSIIVNFISQLTGKKANLFDCHYCEEVIKAGESPTETQKKEIDILDNKSELFSSITMWLNTLSTLLMISSLILLIYFFLATF